MRSNDYICNLCRFGWCYQPFRRGNVRDSSRHSTLTCCSLFSRYLCDRTTQLILCFHQWYISLAEDYTCVLSEHSQWGQLLPQLSLYLWFRGIERYLQRTRSLSLRIAPAGPRVSCDFSYFPDTYWIIRRLGLHVVIHRADVDTNGLYVVLTWSV